MAAATILCPPAMVPQRSSSPVSPTVYDNSQRQSFVSTTAASFFTARASPSTPTSPNPLTTPSGSSTTETLIVPSSPAEENFDSVDKKIDHSVDVHTVQLTNQTVVFETGLVSSPVAEASDQPVAHDIQRDYVDDGSVADSTPVGPPPPSPPASVEQDEPPDMPTLLRHKSDPVTRPSVSIDLAARVREWGASTEPRDEEHPLSRLSHPAFPTAPSDSREFSQRSSTDTARLSAHTSRAGGTVVPHAGRISSQSDGSAITTDTPVTDTSGSPPSQHALQSPGTFLQPPQNVSGRFTRRHMSMGSVIHTVRSAPQPGSSHPNGAIEDDIQIQAEQIRRERKRKAEAEALTRTVSGQRRPPSTKEDDNRPLVGNLIGEDHVNYVLMYNMLTGIRIAVSRCQAKIKRPLTDDDFIARHKYSFDIVGNELTPSAKYDFKFKDYAPWVFRDLREDCFQLDPADYLLSLTAKYILSELGSPGKSGSFFYFSRDYRFIIKTIRHSEQKFLLSVLKKYYAHVKNNPHTLLSRFYGLHRVKLPRGRKIHFVIMNNLFPPHKDIHETFDLKGSTVGRVYPEEKAQKNPRAVLKDLNWIDRGKTLELGPEKRALFTEQLRRDSELLKAINVMDYSLLVGIHHMRRGNKENVRSNTLKVFSPTVPSIHRKSTVKGSRSPEAIAMRRAMRESDPKRLGSAVLQLPEEDTGDRQQFIFYRDDGGLQATDEANQPLDTLYYLGIIDILTPYKSLKKVEHFLKGLSADRHKISPVPPAEYADRFFSFMKVIIRGGGDPTRFKAE